jgi:hypothetical protein
VNFFRRRTEHSPDLAGSPWIHVAVIVVLIYAAVLMIVKGYWAGLVLVGIGIIGSVFLLRAALGYRDESNGT